MSILRMATYANPIPASSQSCRDSASPWFSYTTLTQDQGPQVPLPQAPSQLLDVDHGMQAPHPIFPKPLGLSYRNFQTYYTKYKYENGEQMEVANRLIAALLQFYFPPPNFSFSRLPYQDQSLIDTVEVPGTIYWIVKANCDEIDPGPTKIDHDEGIPDERKDEGEDAKLQNGKQDWTHHGETILLLAIVTERGFRRQRGREQPSALSFSQAVEKTQTHVTIAGHCFEKGHLVILGSKAGPVRPTWEFYTFQAGSEGGSRSLLPWSGQTEHRCGGIGTNSISFAAEDIGTVHWMFEGILKCADGDGAVPMMLESKRDALVDVTNNAQSVSKFRLKLADLERIGMRSDGRLYNLKNGRLLESSKEKVAKYEAGIRGYTFATRKINVNDRRSISRDTTDSLLNAAINGRAYST